MDKFKEILNYEIFNNQIQDYLLFLVLFGVLFLAFRFFRLVVLNRLVVFSEKTKNDFDDTVVSIVSNISKFFYWFLSFYIASRILNIDDFWKNVLNKIFIISVTYEVVIFLGSLIDYFVDKFSKRKDKSSKIAFLALGKFSKWAVWLAAILMLLSNFGVNITAIATGLGIGGLAVAFAFQSVLKDLFSYFTILLDKPIRLGDFIVIGDKKGTVKNIGLKTTRLEAPDGEEIILANDMVTSTDFLNYGKAQYRRVVCKIGVGYNTPIKKLKKIKKDIQKIIEKIDKEKVRFDRCHLKNMDDWALIYELVYYIDDRDYTFYMDVNEKVNLKILELLEKEEVEIPFPTQTIYTRKG